MDLFDLSGEVAFVSGAGAGIGQRIAVGLAEAGADVACFGHGSKGGLQQTADQIAALGRRALVIEGGVTAEAELGAAVALVERELGPLTIAVNNAGVAGSVRAEQMAVDEWRRVQDINVTGVFLCCRAQAAAMLPRKSGSIVNIASMSGSIVNRDLTQAHYNSSKAAVIHLTKSLAMEWAPNGIRVNALSPGYTATAMNRRPEIADQIRIFERDTPLGRLASVDEMVGPAVFLSSRAASYVTGIDLLVDGGYVCW